MFAVILEAANEKERLIAEGIVWLAAGLCALLAVIYGTTEEQSYQKRKTRLRIGSRFWYWLAGAVIVVESGLWLSSKAYPVIEPFYLF